jgi:hypothetical protein
MGSFLVESDIEEKISLALPTSFFAIAQRRSFLWNVNTVMFISSEGF